MEQYDDELKATFSVMAGLLSCRWQTGHEPRLRTSDGDDRGVQVPGEALALFLEQALESVPEDDAFDDDKPASDAVEWESSLNSEGSAIHLSCVKGRVTLRLAREDSGSASHATLPLALFRRWSYSVIAAIRHMPTDSDVPRRRRRR